MFAFHFQLPIGLLVFSEAHYVLRKVYYYCNVSRNNMCRENKMNAAESLFAYAVSNSRVCPILMQMELRKYSTVVVQSFVT